MIKLRIVLRLIFFVALFSNAWGQEKYDTEGPIQGGFQNNTTALLLIAEWNQVTGGMGNSYIFTSQSHHIAVIDVYSVVGWVCTYYVGNCHLANNGSYSYFYYFPYPRGIYFIKVGEQIKLLYMAPGDKYEIFF